LKDFEIKERYDNVDLRLTREYFGLNVNFIFLEFNFYRFKAKANMILNVKMLLKIMINKINGKNYYDYYRLLSKYINFINNYLQKNY